MTPKQQVTLVFFRQINDLSDQKTTPHIEVLLSERSAFQYQDTSPCPQLFFRGKQIFPAKKIGQTSFVSWSEIIIELRYQAGQKICNWIKMIIDQDKTRLIEINKNSFAIEVREDDFASGTSFLDLIDLDPSFQSLDWCLAEDVLGFENLVSYEQRVPNGIQAIFDSDKKVLVDLLEAIKEE